MKARYLVAFAVVGSSIGWGSVQHDVIIKLEHASDLAAGPWSEVPMSASMLTNGRMNAGRVQGDAGFYRISGELVPVATPTPTPVPAPVIESVAVASGSL